jgi:hypothetical protein
LVLGIRRRLSGVENPGFFAGFPRQIEVRGGVLEQDMAGERPQK